MPKVFQILPTVERDSPDSAAIQARDQCVASAGARSKVATTTCSICSSVILRGPLGRGSSTKPSNRSARNLRRHLPSAQPNTDAQTVTVPGTTAEGKKHHAALICPAHRRASRETQPDGIGSWYAPSGP